MVIDLHDAELDNFQRKTCQRHHKHPEYSSKNSFWKVQKNIVTKNPEFVPPIFEINEPSGSF